MACGWEQALSPPGYELLFPWGYTPLAATSWQGRRSLGYTSPPMIMRGGPHVTRGIGLGGPRPGEGATPCSIGGSSPEMGLSLSS